MSSEQCVVVESSKLNSCSKSVVGSSRSEVKMKAMEWGRVPNGTSCIGVISQLQVRSDCECAKELTKAPLHRSNGEIKRSNYVIRLSSKQRAVSRR